MGERAEIHARNIDPTNTHPMKPRITVVTLGVDDLNEAVAFYRDGLGFPTKGIFGTEFEHGAVAFFDLQPGLKLALWPRASISHDSGLAMRERSATEMTIGHNVPSKEEVDAVMAKAAQAGARIVKPTHATFTRSLSFRTNAPSSGRDCCNEDDA